MRYHRPSIPKAVERQLRQEAGFGCVRCGHPYLEYHHIKPWHEEQHFRPEDMVAVCGNCHGFFETQGRDRQYLLKSRPLNVDRGEARGVLEYDKRDLIFRIGSNWYENTSTILRYRDIPLISCRLADGQALVSMNVFNSAGRLVLRVSDNEVIFRVGELWDFECKKNIAIARSGPREIAVKMDFSGDDATIDGRLWAGGRSILLQRDHSNIGGTKFRECRFSDAPVGIQIE